MTIGPVCRWDRRRAAAHRVFLLITARSAYAPFFYARWDAAAQAHDAAQGEQTNEDAAAAFAAKGAFDPAAARAGAAALGSPVEQPGAGHFPWIDDPDRDRFVTAVTEFLSAAVPPETDGHAR